MEPYDLTPEVIEKFAEMLQQGSPILAICDVLGIARRNYYRWRDAGEVDPNQDSLVAQFYRATTKARGKAHAQLSTVFQEQCKKDPRMMLELLKKQYPESWADHIVNKTEATEDGKSLKLTEQEQEELQKLLRKGRL